MRGGGSGGGAAGVLEVGSEEKEWECVCWGLTEGNDGLGAVEKSQGQRRI